MSIHKLSCIAVCLTALFISPALYAHHNTDYGRVLRVAPVYEIQHYSASHKHHQSRRHNTRSRAIAGGIIGAVIGHRVGRDKRLGALVGGVIGAHIGHHSSGNRHAYNQTKHYNRHARHGAYTREVLTGYDVTYRYRGHVYTTFTQNHPGRRIAVVARNKGHSHHRH